MVKMYFFIYSRPLWLIVSAMLALLLLWTQIRARSDSSRWRTANIIFAMVSLLAVIWATLLRRDIGVSSVELMPLASFEAAKIQPEVYRELLMNTFLFFPLGLSIPYVFPNRLSHTSRFILCILCGCVISVGIEVTQYYFSLGTAETDDVIFNTIGTALGAFHIILAVLIRKTNYRNLKK